MRKSPGPHVEPLIVVPDDYCGPALSKLTAGHRAFVVALVRFGCTRAEAARRAGYSKEKPEHARITGYEIAHREDVQAAIAEESRKVMCAEAPKSIAALVQIRDNKKSDPKARIKAATELLNRGGLNGETTHRVVVEDERQWSEEEMRAKIRAILADRTVQRDIGFSVTFADDPDKGVTVIESPEVIARRERNTEQKRLYRSMTPDERKERQRQMREEKIERMRRAYRFAQGTEREPETIEQEEIAV